MTQVIHLPPSLKFMPADPEHSASPLNPEKEGIYFYTFINAQRGKTVPALEQIMQMEQLVHIAIGLGDYDLICLFRVENTAEFGDVVIGKMHEISGITKTRSVILAGKPIFPEADNPSPVENQVQ